MKQFRLAEEVSNLRGEVYFFSNLFISIFVINQEIEIFTKNILASLFRQQLTCFNRRKNNYIGVFIMQELSVTIIRSFP